MISAQAWADAQRLWDFQQMGHEPRPCSVAVGLGSHDLGVADTTADLYHQGMAPARTSASRARSSKSGTYPSRQSF